MKKEIIGRGLVGFPLGIALGYVITVLTSLGWGDGSYIPCMPELVSAMGNEIHAVVVQTLLSGLIGTGFAASSVIWEMDTWSLVKQTGIYFLIVSLVMLPIAYFAYWMEHSIIGFCVYFGIFALVFVVLWAIMYIIRRHHVKQMNEKLSKVKEKQDE